MGVEPRQSCPFLKLESLYTPFTFLPRTASRFTQGHTASGGFENCGILSIAAQSNYNHGFTVLRDGQRTLGTDCVV